MKSSRAMASSCAPTPSTSSSPRSRKVAKPSAYVSPPSVTGYACPVCAGQTEVRDSRAHAYGIRRRRRCHACGHRFTTLETQPAAVVNAESFYYDHILPRLRKISALIDEIEAEHEP